jgi:hypothetical protein
MQALLAVLLHVSGASRTLETTTAPPAPQQYYANPCAERGKTCVVGEERPFTAAGVDGSVCTKQCNSYGACPQSPKGSWGQPVCALALSADAGVTHCAIKCTVGKEPVYGPSCAPGASCKPFELGYADSGICTWDNCGPSTAPVTAPPTPVPPTHFPTPAPTPGTRAPTPHPTPLPTRTPALGNATWAPTPRPTVHALVAVFKVTGYTPSDFLGAEQRAFRGAVSVALGVELHRVSITSTRGNAGVAPGPVPGPAPGLGAGAGPAPTPGAVPTFTYQQGLFGSSDCSGTPIYSPPALCTSGTCCPMAATASGLQLKYTGDCSAAVHTQYDTKVACEAGAGGQVLSTVNLGLFAARGCQNSSGDMYATVTTSCSSAAGKASSAGNASTGGRRMAEAAVAPTPAPAAMEVTTWLAVDSFGARAAVKVRLDSLLSPQQSAQGSALQESLSNDMRWALELGNSVVPPGFGVLALRAASFAAVVDPLAPTPAPTPAATPKKLSSRELLLEKPLTKYILAAVGVLLVGLMYVCCRTSCFSKPWTKGQKEARQGGDAGGREGSGSQERDRPKGGADATAAAGGGAAAGAVAAVAAAAARVERGERHAGQERSQLPLREESLLEIPPAEVAMDNADGGGLCPDTAWGEEGGEEEDEEEEEEEEQEEEDTASAVAHECFVYEDPGKTLPEEVALRPSRGCLSVVESTARGAAVLKMWPASKVTAVGVEDGGAECLDTISIKLEGGKLPYEFEAEEDVSSALVAWYAAEKKKGGGAASSTAVSLSNARVVV